MRSSELKARSLLPTKNQPLDRTTRKRRKPLSGMAYDNDRNFRGSEQGTFGQRLGRLAADPVTLVCLLLTASTPWLILTGDSIMIHVYTRYR